MTTCADFEAAPLLKAIKKLAGPNKNKQIDLVLNTYGSIKEGLMRLQKVEEVADFQISSGFDEKMCQRLADILNNAKVVIPREDFAQKTLERWAEWGFDSENANMVIFEELLENDATRVPWLCLVGQALALEDAMKGLQELSRDSIAAIEKKMSEEDRAAVPVERQRQKARWN